MRRFLRSGIENVDRILCASIGQHCVGARKGGCRFTTIQTRRKQVLIGSRRIASRLRRLRRAKPCRQAQSRILGGEREQFFRTRPTTFVQCKQSASDAHAGLSATALVPQAKWQQQQPQHQPREKQPHGEDRQRRGPDHRIRGARQADDDLASIVGEELPHHRAEHGEREA